MIIEMYRDKCSLKPSVKHECDKRDDWNRWILKYRATVKAVKYAAGIGNSLNL